jgi:hypothetical protein
MSNKLWVKWLDPIKGEWLFDKVRKLADDADVADMRVAFVEQLEPDIRRPSYVIVHEKEGDRERILQPDSGLAQYFIPPASTSEATTPAGPGMSLKTALFLTFPVPKEQNTVSRSD